MAHKNLLLILSTLCILFTISSCSQKEENMYQKINLATNWNIRHTDSIKSTGDIISTPQQSVVDWYKASVPSTVMGTLTANGLYPDLFTGNNIKDIDRSLFDKSFWYRNEFTLPQLSKDQHVTLNFDGISYYANIWLNGKLIASRDSVYGAFRHFSYDITPHIQANNVLAVEVFRAGAGDPNIGFADWNPRPADENMGIYRNVSLSITGNIKLKNTYVQPKVNTATLDEAWLMIETEVENLTDSEISGELIGTIESREFSYPVILAPKEKKKVKITSEEAAILHMKNPRLWWCNNMGKPELYNLSLKFKSGDIVSDKDDVTFGVREIESYLTEKGYRGFKLNGKNVLLKSAGWTDDIFLRDTPESNEIQVQYVKDMNMNMIRFESFWGTSSNIYDLCDKYGLMAVVGWSCQWEWEAYYGKPCDDMYGCILTDEEIDLIAESFATQVLWLRNHPSIISWMPGSDMLPTPKLEEKYLAFLKESDNRIYVGAAKERTSELSGKTGTKMAGPYEYVGPNYWYIDTLYGGAFGYNTETGIGAQLPVLESVKKFIPENKLWPISEAWDYHCTTSTSAMNTLKVLTAVINDKYGQAKNLEDYMMKADLVNYDGTRAMFEAFRVNLGNTTGIVQWMLNSAWPSLYWQMYDYYKVPTAAYYSVKKGNQPLQLIYNYGNNSVYVVNELVEDISSYKVIIQTFEINSKLKEKKEITLDVKSNSSVQILQLPILTENIFLSLEILDKEGKAIADNFYCLSSKQDEYYWDKTDWVHTPAKSYSDFKNLSSLETVKLNIKTSKAETDNDITYAVSIENPSQTIAFFVNIKMKDNKGEMVVPVFWSENYISLLPGQKKIIECKIDKDIINGKGLKIEAKGWNSPLSEINL
ncbi:MAG: glycoside hydrolase family 2 [Prevotella sp.]|nr:glycoside hydrolase family 2 [Prevotella sp.]